jgi:hypothetical protein
VFHEYFVNNLRTITCSGALGHHNIFLFPKMSSTFEINPPFSMLVDFKEGLIFLSSIFLPFYLGFFNLYASMAAVIIKYIKKLELHKLNYT